jgi:4-hydroxy-3-methylbut-2-enyl diphosphate reductase
MGRGDARAGARGDGPNGPVQAGQPYGCLRRYDNPKLTVGHGAPTATARGLEAGRGYDGCMSTPGKVLLAAPRGYCAGVERAVDAVERALAKHGAPVYVRKQIVHNLHVVRDLEDKGAIFVEEETEVPEGAVVVLSAHGVAPDVYANSGSRHLEVIDATCPLVTKVHVEARRFAADGRTIVLIGHAGHEEVVGTTGQAPERTILVGSPEEARRVEVTDPEHLSYLTQTTLSVDETNEIVRILQERFPTIEGPPRDDICYATQNRQDAVKVIAPKADVVLVIGSKNSSNSNRLAELSRELGTPAHLVDDETSVDAAWLEGADVVGLTSGASAPEWLVERMIAWLADQGFPSVEEVTLTEEHVKFSLPAGVRRIPLSPSA